MTGWQTDCCNGLLLPLETCILKPCVYFLCTWTIILEVLWSRETLNAHTDDHLAVFNDFWTDFGTSCNILCVWFYDFLWFVVSNWGKVSSFMFSKCRGWKWCQKTMSPCAITAMKNMCFEWFCFFYFFGNSMSGVRSNRQFDLFGRPKASFFDFLSVLEACLNFGNFLKCFLGDPGLRQRRQRMVIVHSVATSNSQTGNSKTTKIWYPIN